MNRKTTLAGLGLVAVTVGTLGVGTAFASTHTPTSVKVSHGAPAAETPSATDTDNVQQGDQSGSDQADAASEQASSEAGPSDGPGGYADTNPNADTQQQGDN